MSYPTTPPGQPYGLTPDDKTWGGAAHWSALVGAFVALAFLGPLVVMLTKGTTSPYVRRHAVESLNFQLSMLIYGVAGSVVALVLTLLTFGLGILLVIPVALAFGVFWLVFTIIGSMKGAEGADYRYPLTIRMVS